MNFDSASQYELSFLQNLAETAITIDKRCRMIVGLISEALQRDSMIGAGACTLDVSMDDKVLATLKSPIGAGRIVRTWSKGEDSLQAELNFQREQFDQYGRQYWESVWGLTVPYYGHAYSGTGTNAMVFDLGTFADNVRRSAFFAAGSMLYGLINGPMLSAVE